MNQRAAIRDTLALLRVNGMQDCSFDEPGIEYAHFANMYERILEADTTAEPFSNSKIGRWLGWIQGAATAAGFMTLEDAKEINKRHAED